MVLMTSFGHPTKVVRAWGMILIGLILTGCATKGDIRDLRDEIRALAARQDSILTELRLETESTQDTLKTQSDQLFDFRGQVTMELRRIAESLDRLEALTGENQRGLMQLRDQLSNLRRGAPAGAAEAVVGGVSEELPLPAAAPEELFRTAQEQLERGSLMTARMAFRQFVESYPNHALTPDAYFFLADILEQEGDAQAAMAAFREVQTRFPTAPRVPDALYRIAKLQIKEGDIEGAIETLERVINTYPDSDIAELAAETLAEIR